MPGSEAADAPCEPTPEAIEDRHMTGHRMRTAADALNKVVQALHFTEAHLAAVDTAGAALELEDRVRNSPLTTIVSQAKTNAVNVRTVLRALADARAEEPPAGGATTPPAGGPASVARAREADARSVPHA